MVDHLILWALNNGSTGKAVLMLNIFNYSNGLGKVLCINGLMVEYGETMG